VAGGQYEKESILGRRKQSFGGHDINANHGFNPGAVGKPYGEVVLDANGNIFGMASGEGTSGSSGAVYEITP